jgi:hypothetical protein
MAGDASLETGAMAPVARQISIRQVLYHHERFDITKAVLERLNARYPEFEPESKDK